MTITILNRLHDSGDLRSLVLSGIISVNVLEWRKIHNTYTSQINAGRSKTEAVRDAADVHNVSERTVFRVLEKLNYQPATNEA